MYPDNEEKSLCTWQGRTWPLSSVAFIEFADKCSLAIQDVLAIHKKHEGMPNLQTPQGDFYQCVACQEIYPCSTRIRITNRLGGVK